MAGTAPSEGLVFVLSGPAGAGKTELIGQLISSGFPIAYCVTATTRQPRHNPQTGQKEEHGISYYFLSRERFCEHVERNEMLEWSVVHGEHLYGIPIASARRSLREGNDLLMTPEVQGAEIVREKLPGVITIFLRTTSLQELDRRMKERGTPAAERRIRLATARLELLKEPNYEYVVINYRDRLDEAVDQVKAIITAERVRRKRRIVTI
jgi:guanylate kinase